EPVVGALMAFLNPKQKKIQSHVIQSVRSRVGSIRPYLATEYQNMSVWEFTDYIIFELVGIDDMSEAKKYELSQEDWESIDKIAAEKYRDRDWNYGRFQHMEYPWSTL